MARDFNGSSDKLEATLDLSAYSTVAIGAWINFDTLIGSGTNILWSLSPTDWSTASGGLSAYYQATNLLCVGHCGNVGLNFAFASLGPTTNAWHYILFLYDFTKAGNEVDIYYDGVLQSVTRSVNNNNASGTVFQNDTFRIAESFDGKMERLGIWAGDPGADAAMALYRGVPTSRIRSDIRIDDWPLWGNASPEPDDAGRTALTVTGAVHAAGPSANRPFDGANWWPGAFTASGAAATTPKLIGGNLIRPNLVRGRLAA